MEQRTNNELLGENYDIVELIHNIRVEEKISLTDLAMGLMSPSQLGKIEKGERPLEKNIRDRILERLGMAKEMYENLLDNGAYEDWKYRKDIISAIRERESEKAKQLIDEFAGRVNEKDKINRQFILVMQAEQGRQAGLSENAVIELYQEAVKLTIPDIDKVWNKKYPLSVLEINLLLEAVSDENDVYYFHKCRVLMEYVQTGRYDAITKAKIYPKIAYFYLKRQRVLKNHWGQQEGKENLQLCNDAIEVLRDAGRTYYLVELLEIKMEILEVDAEKSALEMQETTELLDLMKRLYTEYGVSVYMEESTYLYNQNCNFRIGQIIKVRREMFGMTQEQLCDGICSVKSLRRLELGKSDMQMENLKKLLNRLGLPGQMQWSRIITSNPEAIRLAEESESYQNRRDFVMARKKLENMKLIIPLDISQNKQYIMEREATLDFDEGKIDEKEFLIKEGEVLKITLHVDNLLSKSTVYLTKKEVSCIRNGWKGLEWNIKKQYIQFLIKYYDEIALNNSLENIISEYEFVMQGVVDELGNNEEYDWAVEIDKKSIKESLFCRRLWGIDYKLYDVLWNKDQTLKKYGKNLDKKEMTDGLRECITISHFLKRYYYEDVFKNMLINH